MKKFVIIAVIGVIIAGIAAGIFAAVHSAREKAFAQNGLYSKKFISNLSACRPYKETVRFDSNAVMSSYIRGKRGDKCLVVINNVMVCRFSPDDVKTIVNAAYGKGETDLKSNPNGMFPNPKTLMQATMSNLTGNPNVCRLMPVKNKK